MGLEDHFKRDDRINKEMQETPKLVGNEVVLGQMNPEHRDRFLNVMQQNYNPERGMDMAFAYEQAMNQLQYEHTG